MELYSTSDTEESLFEDCELGQNIQGTNNFIVMENCKESYQAGPSTNKRGRTLCINDKFVTVLDRCTINDRDITHILITTVQALRCNVDKLVINRTSIYRDCEKVRKR